jgi:hypothetical protein
MKIKSETLEDLYCLINRIVFSKVSKDFFYRGYQKIDINLQASCKVMGIFPYTLEHLGYTKLKFNNLVKHYFSNDELIKYLAALEKGFKAKQASVFFQTNGAAKGDHKKDFCIRGVGVNIIKGKIVNVHVFYRSSELSKKFLADLVFFQSFLFKELHIPSTIPINFHFVCGYVHAKQFPAFIGATYEINRKPPEFDWEDEVMRGRVFSNIYNLMTDTGSAGFGMIKATNRDFKERLKTDSFQNYLRELNLKKHT